MKRGPGMRRIEKGDEEGYGGVAMNVCLGIQKIQHIFNMTQHETTAIERAGGLYFLRSFSLDL